MTLVMKNKWVCFLLFLYNPTGFTSTRVANEVLKLATLMLV